MAIDRSDTLDRINHLANEVIPFLTDHEVTWKWDGPLSVEFRDVDGIAEPLYVSGSTWRDLYDSLCAIEDAYDFYITLARED